MKATAIVTGATGGIGKAIVDRLAQTGFSVLALGTKPQQLSVLEETGCRTLALDIGDAGATQAALAGIEADVLVHAAGVLGPQLPLYETPDELAARLVSVNILGTVNVLREVVPSMRRRDRGTIVLLGSICGTAPGTGPALYSATKAALHSMAANLRYDLRGSGLRVCEILLGRVRTGIHEQLASGEDLYDGYECLLPENVADTVLHAVTSPPSVDLSTIEMMPTRQTVGGSHFSRQ
ncbi:SDR family oxidoreductase [Mesorhizobium comanense]|uniref:SDR family oxidoreductase n=1 Tax=Mesorhizobium comanense TaxID=2502215 RepID=UPI0010F4F881|nr:SDR family NAD(P)-dependent oxidoreductase [Mesorhizobium comanense]